MPLSQNDNVVGGSIAGRDLIQITNQPGKTQIALLCERLNAEQGSHGAPATAFMEELQHFLDRAPVTAISRSLNQKLSDTGRSDVAEFAELMKERAFKKIMRLQSSNTAQEILVHVLGELRVRFLSHVTPLIASNAGRVAIDAAMHDQVVAPVAAALTPTPLMLNPDSVQGLLYFLAGNCHVKWD